MVYPAEQFLQNCPLKSRSCNRTVGIMGERIFPAVEEGIKIYLKSHADSKISSMMFHEQDGANDGFAANWHPTEKTHKKAAAVLMEKLREIIKSI